MGAKIFTVDIETRPTEAYVWGLFDQNVGLSQIIRPGGLLMFCAKEYGQAAVDAYTEWGTGYDDMVRASHRIFDEADYIVSYNGANFDSKHLRAAWLQLGLTPPSPWREIDLLRVVRKNLQLPSKKLAFVCRHLGLDAKTDPGGFDTWVAILDGEGQERDDARQRMIDYCANDVRITEQLFDRLRPWIDGMNLPLYAADGFPSDTPSCSRCSSDKIQSRGWAYTTTFRYRRYQCQACGGWMRAKASESLYNTELRNA